MYAQRGYAVLYTNPRGSDGYGQDFADVIKEDWHTHPTIDLMAFVDHAIDMGVADPDRLGVTGGSYGGYMTNWLIGATDRFKAAVSVAGLSNMVSFYGSTDEQFFVEHEMAGPPWLNKEKYLDNSPLWQAENFVSPTMVIHGSNDWRVRPEQGRQLFVALQKMGVPSVWVEFPNEQHGVRSTTHRELYYRLKLDWFGHWLKGEDPGLATYITPKKYQHPPEMLEPPKH
jgi:dipeptidyl aminopeptidase/acylaminoacyl peptidase